MNTLTIVKVSGKIVENPDALKVFIKQFSAIKGRRILIHSGANLAGNVGQKMGIRTAHVDGRPVVDESTMKLLAMVYGGFVNKQLVTLLQGRNVNAIGLTGADGNLITSLRRSLNDVDMGQTGEVRNVNAKLLSMLLDAGMVPVIAPLTHDGKGNMLFNETDAMAAEIAKALATRYTITLVYCFEKKGVLTNEHDPDSVVPELRRTRYKTMRDMGIIKDWFVNKLDNAFSAIDHGVKEVVITNAANLANTSLGTHIK